MIPSPGTYRHYKGGIYTVIGTVVDSDTGRHRILYRGHGEYKDLGLTDPYFVRSVEERAICVANR